MGIGRLKHDHASTWHAGCWQMIALSHDVKDCISCLSMNALLQPDLVKFLKVSTRLHPKDMHTDLFATTCKAN